MTGVPHAIDSKFVVGYVSAQVGLINAIAFEYRRLNSCMLSVRLIPIIPAGRLSLILSETPTSTIPISLGRILRSW